MKLSSMSSITVLLAIVTGQSHAASFNCDKATTKTEKAICQSAELSALDERIADNYTLYIQKGNDPNAQSTQKAWIKLQQSCEGNYKCLKWVYTEWIKEFYFGPYKEIIQKPDLEFPYPVSSSFDWRTCDFSEEGLFTCSSSLADWDKRYQACSTGINVYQLENSTKGPQLRIWRDEQSYLKSKRPDQILSGTFEVHGTGPCRHTLINFEQASTTASITFFEGCGPGGEDAVIYPNLSMFEIDESINNSSIQQGACRALPLNQ